jgi:hypothetical protein
MPTPMTTPARIVAMSSRTMPRTSCRPLAPSAARTPNSRVRWATLKLVTP